MTLAISSHGWIISRAKAATPTVFTEIAELQDITMPGLMRNEFDASVQNRNIDDYVLGILRRESPTFTLNFLPTDASHDHLTGLNKAIIDNTVDGYKFTSPDAATVYVHSGQVKAFTIKAPVDGKLSADVQLRFSGKFTINGIVVGN